jgi:hypothetical protein
MLIMNSRFSLNTASRGGLLTLPESTVGDIQVRGTLFSNNTAQKGGAIYIEGPLRQSALKLRVSQCRIEDNTANTGGAVFQTLFDSIELSNNTFINNTAKRYGTTFATEPTKFSWAVNKSLPATSDIVSGGSLSPFAVTVKDDYSNIPISSDLRTDFVFLHTEITNVRNPNQTQALILVDQQKPILQGETQATFKQTQIVGLPGEYNIKITSLINYDPKSFFLQAPVRILACDPPKVLHLEDIDEVYPSCVERNFFLLLYVLSD